MAHFTFALSSRSPFLRDRVTPGSETTFSHVNTLTRLPEITPRECLKEN